MLKFALMSCFLMGCIFISCSQPTDTLHESSVDEPLTPIIQLADLLQGSQRQTMEFHISDYFDSKVPIVNSVLYSDELQITVTSLGDGRFRLSQPEELSGEFRIQARITNSDNETLEAELLYLIEENSEPPVPSDEVLVIMPLGDSMTNDSRSRVKLWNLLNDGGYKLDYVGNQYQESSIPDADHEGVGGIKIGGIMDKAVSLMQSHSPGYVALMVGTNDIAWYFDETATEIADRWKDLIERIFDSSEPGTYVLAATIPPVSPRNVGQPDMAIQDRAIMVQHYNAELRSYIKDRNANGDHIILADMEAVLDPDKHLSSDGVHLNEAGYAIMGTVYYDALIEALKEQE
ncbi:MAG: GDSL-type esterase/lipase family protein [Balneolaceae bacterium]